jgi:glycosyltransferase involved in cell wall biosynthesis
VPTRTTAKELAGFQPFTKKKLVVTYEASEPPLPIKPKQPKGVDGEFILYVGTAFPHKNLPKLVEAFDILQTKHPNLKLVLTGKTEKHYQELKAWASGHKSFPSIIFTGFVPDESLKWLYENCQAYVFASLSEGFGLPPLEAMAHGAPVVSSNASVMPEVYGDAALYCDALSPKDIAQRVSNVLADKKLRTQLINSGYKQVKKYSWQHMAEETLTVYQDLLTPETDIKEPEF